MTDEDTERQTDEQLIDTVLTGLRVAVSSNYTDDEAITALEAAAVLKDRMSPGEQTPRFQLEDSVTVDDYTDLTDPETYDDGEVDDEIEAEAKELMDEMEQQEDDEPDEPDTDEGNGEQDSPVFDDDRRTTKFTHTFPDEADEWPSYIDSDGSNAYIKPGNRRYQALYLTAYTQLEKADLPADSVSELPKVSVDEVMETFKNADVMGDMARGTLRGYVSDNTSPTPALALRTDGGGKGSKAGYVVSEEGFSFLMENGRPQSACSVPVTHDIRQRFGDRATAD